MLSGFIKSKAHYPPSETVWLIPHEALRLMLLRFLTAIRSGSFEPHKNWKVDRAFDYLDLVAKCFEAYFETEARILPPEVTALNLPSSCPSREDLLRSLRILTDFRTVLLGAGERPAQATTILGDFRQKTRAFCDALGDHFDAVEHFVGDKILAETPPGTLQLMERRIVLSMLAPKDSDTSAFLLGTALSACADKDHGWGSAKNVAALEGHLPLCTRLVMLPLSMAPTYKKRVARLGDITKPDERARAKGTHGANTSGSSDSRVSGTPADC